MNILTLTPRERIAKARIQMQESYPFFSYLVMGLKPIDSSNDEMWMSVMPTMSINENFELRFSNEFVNKLTIPELSFVLTHEVMHIVLQQLGRVGKRHPAIWNIAMDITTNALIQKDIKENPSSEFKISPPKTILIPVNDMISIPALQISIDNISTKTTEKIYDEIIDALKSAGRNQSVVNQILSNNGLTRNKGKYGNKKGDEDEKSPNNNGKNDKEGKGNHQNTPEEMIANQLRRYRNHDIHENLTKLTRQERKQIEDTVKKMVAEAYTFSKQKGNVPGWANRILRELVEPKVNWRHLLWNFVSRHIPFDFTYQKRSRRSISTGIYMPGIKKEELDVVIAVDSSGSITDKEFTDFMSEVDAILKTYQNVNVDLLVCDATIQQVHHLNNGDDLRKLKMTGKGGTDFRPVFDWINKNKPYTRCLIYLTDGEGDFPREENVSYQMNTLWILVEDGIQPEELPFGIGVKIKGEVND